MFTITTKIRRYPFAICIDDTSSSLISRASFHLVGASTSSPLLSRGVFFDQQQQQQFVPLSSSLLSSPCLFQSSRKFHHFHQPLPDRKNNTGSNEEEDATENNENTNNNNDESNKSSNGDYYRIETLNDATPPDHVIEWKSSRGSGPGGQAVNTSQNKAELRVNLQRWHLDDPLILDLETFEKLKRDHAKKVTNDDVLILTSHMHRSLEKNKEECLSVVRKIVRDASYVPPALNPTMKFDPTYVKRVVMPKKRKQANFNKMKRQVRAGKF